MAIELRSTTTLSDIITTTKATATSGNNTNTNSNYNHLQQLLACICANANLVLFTLMLALGKCCTATPINTPSLTHMEQQVLPPTDGATLIKHIDGKSILSMGFKFLNVSGKIGTPLGIGERNRLPVGGACS